jgi:squalene cyclase
MQENGGWKFIATSNLVMQALIMAGRSGEIDQSIRWLLKKQNDNGSWGKNNEDITATAQSLITLALYTNS